MRIRRVYVVVIVILAVSVYYYGSRTRSTPTREIGAEVGLHAPDFTLRDLSGERVRRRDLEGSPLLLNFWTTWCPACVVEMEAMEELYPEWEGRVEFASINLGEPEDTVSEFVEEKGITWTVLLDPTRETAGEFLVRYIPHTVLIDREGVIRNRWIGVIDPGELIKALTAVYEGSGGERSGD